MRRLSVYIFIFLLSVSWSARVLAEEVLTWEDCVKETLINHPDLIAAAEKVVQTRADKNITRSAVLPDLSSQLSAKTSESSSGNTQDAYAYSFTAKQLIFDGFKSSSDIKEASRTLTAQEYNYIVASSNIRLNLRVAFVTLLRAQELIALTREIADRRKQNLELVQLRYEAGREHKGALFTAEADFAEAEFEVSQSERNLSFAQRGLIKELGREKNIPVKIRGAFNVQKVDHKQKHDFESLAGETAFFKALIAKKEAARFGYCSAKADFFPQVYLNGSVGRTHSKWPPQDDEWSAGITVSFPVFEGGSRLARISKAESQLKQAEADERSGRDSVVLTLEETWKNFQDAIETVSVKNKFLEAARERAKIASAQYSQGLVTFDDWIIIENNLVNAKKDYLNAQSNLLIAEANWIQAKGGTLEYVQK